MNITVYLGANEGMILLLEKRCVSWEPGSVKAVTAWCTVDPNPVLWERSRRAYYRQAAR